MNFEFTLRKVNTKKGKIIYSSVEYVPSNAKTLFTGNFML
jgi:hypothetical protein